MSKGLDFFRQAEEARKKRAAEAALPPPQFGGQYLGNRGTGKEWGGTINKTGYEFRPENRIPFNNINYPLPQIQDPYQRMQRPNYQYKNKSPRLNANSGDLSSAYTRNSSGLLAGLLGDSARGVSDLQSSMRSDANSEIVRNAQVTNAGLGVEDNQLEQSGLTQQANLYSKINERAESQMGLAQQMQSARLKDHMAQVNTAFSRFRGKYTQATGQVLMGNAFDNFIANGLFATG